MDVKVFTLADTALLPAAPGTCPECAVAHDPELPHDLGSLFYQYKFRQANGRWPTQEDAFAHVSPGVRAAWERLQARVTGGRRENGYGA